MTVGCSFCEGCHGSLRETKWGFSDRRIQIGSRTTRGPGPGDGLPTDSIQGAGEPDRCGHQERHAAGIAQNLPYRVSGPRNDARYPTRFQPPLTTSRTYSRGGGDRIQGCREPLPAPGRPRPTARRAGTLAPDRGRDDPRRRHAVGRPSGLNRPTSPPPDPRPGWGRSGGNSGHSVGGGGWAALLAAQLAARFGG